MKKITAAFTHYCAETGEQILKGMECYYDHAKKLFYTLRAEAVRAFLMEPDTQAGMLQANEEPVRFND